MQHGGYQTSDVAVAILNWNGRHLLQQFLPSVIAHLGDASCYVIDNASSDDSVEWLKNTFPTVKIVCNIKNGGFSYGYNQAMPQIAEPLVVLLNNDVQVSAGWLEALLHTFNKHPNTFAVQAKIKAYTNRRYFDYAGAAGGYLDVLGYPYCRGRIFETIEEDQGQYDSEQTLDWASGACMLVDKKLFIDLGGLDEAFFAHMEEIDLCWRARIEGYTIWICPAAEVFHLGGASLHRMSTYKTFLNFRNSLIMLAKNLTGRHALWRIMFRLVLDGITGLYFLFLRKPTHTWAIVRAHASFYGYTMKHLFTTRSAKATTALGTKFIVWEYFFRLRKHYSDIFP